MAKNSTKNALKALPAGETAVTIEQVRENSVLNKPVADLADEMAENIAGATFSGEVVLSTPLPATVSEMLKTQREIALPDGGTASVRAPDPASVPTIAAFNAVLGRFKVGDKEYVGDRNGTRWIADIELDGSTAVDLKIELLGHGTGAPIVPPLVSFTLGAGNGNFYVARPHIVEEKGVLFLRTVALKMAAKVKLRLAIDTYHSSNR